MGCCVSKSPEPFAQLPASPLNRMVSASKPTKNAPENAEILHSTFLPTNTAVKVRNVAATKEGFLRHYVQGIPRTYVAMLCESHVHFYDVDNVSEGAEKGSLDLRFFSPQQPFAINGCYFAVQLCGVQYWFEASTALEADAWVIALGHALEHILPSYTFQFPEKPTRSESPVAQRPLSPPLPPPAQITNPGLGTTAAAPVQVTAKPEVKTEPPLKREPEQAPVQALEYQSLPVPVATSNEYSQEYGNVQAAAPFERDPVTNAPFKSSLLVYAAPKKREVWAILKDHVFMLFHPIKKETEDALLAVSLTGLTNDDVVEETSERRVGFRVAQEQYMFVAATAQLCVEWQAALYASIQFHQEIPQFSFGDRVMIDGSMEGTVRFVGETQFAPGTWIGAELTEAAGKNDGSVQGVIYFRCNPLYGLFVRPSRCALLRRAPSKSVSFAKLELPEPVPSLPISTTLASTVSIGIESKPQRKRTDAVAAAPTTPASAATPGKTETAGVSSVAKPAAPASPRRESNTSQPPPQPVDDVVLKGLLYKRGDFFKSWKQRWFVLSQNNILYYPPRTQDAGDAIGFVELDGLKPDDIQPTKASERENSFEIRTKDRRWLFSASTPANRDRWIKALRDSVKLFAGR